VQRHTDDVGDAGEAGHRSGEDWRRIEFGTTPGRSDPEPASRPAQPSQRNYC